MEFIKISSDCHLEEQPELGLSHTFVHKYQKVLLYML